MQLQKKDFMKTEQNIIIDCFLNFRIFLNEHAGNPNKTNGRKETALHCVCMEKSPQYYPVQRRRVECLSLMLQWRGAELKDGEIEHVDLAAKDEVCHC